MSLIPSGLSIQEAYRRYRNGHIVVNRKYQRKLVWTEDEKQMLIDSVLNHFPIPLILFAEHTNRDGSTYYEILDGMQRLNAIFGFIENEFGIKNKFFDVNELSRAKQLAEEGLFKISDDTEKLSAKDCANFLDYQLAVTSYQVIREETVIEVFGRINSGGKRLSNQERRQAGVVNYFAELVRKISAELRGDATAEIVLLTDMPAISIGSLRSNPNYGLLAENIFWVKQGILSVQNLRDSDDEEMIADIVVSVLFDEPLARSKESLDEIYNLESELSKKVESAFIHYGQDRLYNDIKTTFSVLKNLIETYSSEDNFLRKIVAPRVRSPIKGAFYTIFMAFFKLLVKSELSPADPKGMFKAMKGLQSKLTSSTHYTNIEDRKKNISLTVGLLQDYFVKKEPSSLKQGPGLALDFENSIMRSKIETPRYEYKQGFLRLSIDRKYDNGVEMHILQTICGMANIGPTSAGYIFIGVADKDDDAKRISELDHITPIKVSNRYVVGVDREAKQLGKTVEEYCRGVVSFIRDSELSEPLKSQVLSSIDMIDYKGLTAIMIKVPAQSELSYLGDDTYLRKGNDTTPLKSAKEITAVVAIFNK